MASESQKRAMKKYGQKTRQFIFRLRRDADADVIERIDGMPSKVDYLRELVRSDIESEQAEDGGE